MNSALRLFLIFSLTLSSFQALSSVIIYGTRVIYPSDEKEITVRLENNGNKPSLVQVWMDKGDSSAKVSQLELPFVILPPVARIEPAQGQTLRITYTGDNLPQDRESVFWLNVLDIPARQENATSNRIEMAFRSRIKFFYRPSGLNIGSVGEQVEKLSWSTAPCDKKQCIVIKNPTPLFVTLSNIKIMSGDKVITSLSGSMIPPFGSESYPSKTMPGSNPLFIEYINDFGSPVKLQIKHE
ncbi:fimbrial biogenesis chaperone [Intestinirhabdus alba]|jgi:chaperone protein EcpD|uniref:Fimbria/pilus periplasmic chaperone n=1 Tax=Intestinirhabdus alba TaxID=2899544 RepID=A0A6L6IIK4_9ENTR|nr:fimbria/pilus periplasmic chaperone [Intestinirhabdus alba]MTH45707.1 fimbria/pilus periplasmic chaperone [Intestinirhabdus alba]